MTFFKKHKFFALTLAAMSGIFFMSMSSQASTDHAENKIRENYKLFADILNAKAEPEALIDFMHSSISQDAEFLMDISNAEGPSKQNTEAVLSKADYINSYLYGPRMVKGYNIQINVENVEALGDNSEWVSKVNFVESGAMQDIQDVRHRAKPFTSYTSCATVHGYEDDSFVLIKATCRTEILYEQDV